MDHTQFFSKELWGLVAYPDRIGRGTAREVFANRLDPDTVWKVEDTGRSFQNVNEWEYWKHVELSEMSLWLAPCVAVSATGSILLQKRTYPVPIGDLPKKVPAVFTDLKTSNWGMYDGRVVCHDYGKLLLDANADMKLRKADWWEEMRP